jgi:tRNA U34 5-methylaminomethyl-2-thiouridine-forming methyltransferase MnmC
MRKIVTTADGSKSIQITDTEEQYHSKHGAILEAKHVFIQSGLHYLISNTSKPISIFEMGFGTGLNCFLTYLEAIKHNLSVQYTGIDVFPVELSEIEQLNFHELLDVQKEVYLNLHRLEWGKEHYLHNQFSLLKLHQKLQQYDAREQYNLVYFDAFGSKTQPELWTQEVTDQLYKILQPNGLVVTYSVKGSFRRALIESGFTVEKIPGPPGKREMLRAIK